jgi:adenylate cyclase
MEAAVRKSAFICRGCWDQMHVPIPIRGVLAMPLRAFGITRSKMNPNICTICERSFRYVKKQSHISANATILFADIRGFTDLSERMSAVELGRVVSVFQDQCAQAIWDHDGIVNKQMGDGLMAIFNFPIKITNHAEAAILAARDIQSHCAEALRSLGLANDRTAHAIGVGVGIHSGDVEIGEFSSFRSDFTAIGGAVNLSSRLESQAAAGEIIVSSETAALAPGSVEGAKQRTLVLKGIDRPTPVHVVTTH